MTNHFSNDYCSETEAIPWLTVASPQKNEPSAPRDHEPLQVFPDDSRSSSGIDRNHYQHPAETDQPHPFSPVSAPRLASSPSMGELTLGSNAYSSPRLKPPLPPLSGTLSAEASPSPPGCKSPGGHGSPVLRSKGRRLRCSEPSAPRLSSSTPVSPICHERASPTLPPSTTSPLLAASTRSPKLPPSTSSPRLPHSEGTPPPDSLAQDSKPVGLFRKLKGSLQTVSAPASPVATLEHGMSSGSMKGSGSASPGGKRVKGFAKILNIPGMGKRRSAPPSSGTGSPSECDGEEITKSSMFGPNDDNLYALVQDATKEVLADPSLEDEGSLHAKRRHARRKSLPVPNRDSVFLAT
eukprot:Rmarinus@m.26453